MTKLGRKKAVKPPVKEATISSSLVLSSPVLPQLEDLEKLSRQAGGWHVLQSGLVSALESLETPVGSSPVMNGKESLLLKPDLSRYIHYSISKKHMPSQKALDLIQRSIDAAAAMILKQVLDNKRLKLSVNAVTKRQQDQVYKSHFLRAEDVRQTASEIKELGWLNCSCSSVAAGYVAAPLRQCTRKHKVHAALCEPSSVTLHPALAYSSCGEILTHELQKFAGTC